MTEYYSNQLAAEQLRRVYEIAPPRVRQYLDAEIAYVIEHIRPGNRVLDLGCGYGRVLAQLAKHAGYVIGVDTAASSLQMAAAELRGNEKFGLAKMNAVQMGLLDGVFDCTVCIQNGISAFHEDPKLLVGEAVRVTRPGGAVLLSSYSESFWPHRLAWFEAQAEAGLIGAIDYERTGNGQIVCRDGFTATTFSPAQFRRLTAELSLPAVVCEIEQSSVFCVITRPNAASAREVTPE